MQSSNEAGGIESCSLWTHTYFFVQVYLKKLVNISKAKTNADLLKFLGLDPVTGRESGQTVHVYVLANPCVTRYVFRA